MKATWALSAPPVPTTAFFTTLAAYSATDQPGAGRRDHGRGAGVAELQGRGGRWR